MLSDEALMLEALETLVEVDKDWVPRSEGASMYIRPFVFAGLAFVGIGFLCVHYAIMHTVFLNPDMWRSQPQVMPPKAFVDAFIWFYLFMGVLLLTGLVLNVLSGVFLLQKRNRLFSFIIGGLNCLQIPFGTALGVFTILVLSRESVRELYTDSMKAT